MKVVNRNIHEDLTRYLVTVRVTYKKHAKGTVKTLTMPVFARSVHLAEAEIKTKLKTWVDVKKSEILFVEDTSTGIIK